jgi:hypothetical protein
MNSLPACLIAIIFGAVIGVGTTVVALTASDDFVLVRDVYGSSVVKYQGDYYKLVPVEIKGTVEVVD